MSEKRYGATTYEWDHFSLIGLEEDMLPVVSNPLAKLSPRTSLKELGKAPSLYNKNREVIGIPDWTEKKPSPGDVDFWKLEPDYGICLQTRQLVAIDADITDKDLAEDILRTTQKFVGVLPTRIRRNSTKFLMCFYLDGKEFSKRVLKTAHGKIEFLARGQQFIAAGTHKTGFRYEWAGGLPDTILRLPKNAFEDLWRIYTEKYAIEPPTESRTRNPKTKEDAQKILNDPIAKFLADRVLSIGKEGQLFIECFNKSEHTTDNGETETAYFCAGTRGYQQGHFKCMHSHCAKFTNDDFLNAYGYYAADFENVQTAEDKKKEAKTRFKLIPADQYLKREPVDWLIKGIIPMRSAGMTYGGSGDGKTFIALDMACSIALGIPWQGRKVKRGKVVYVCAEGAGGFTSRIESYAKHNEIQLPELGKYLTVVPASPNFLKKDDVLELVTEIRKVNENTDLIVVDTLAQTSTGGDENSAKDMGVLLKHIQLVRDLTGAASDLIHHTGKDESRGARGTTALKADCDFQLSVSRDGEKRVLWVAKMKDGPDNFGWHFRLDSITLRKDEDNEDVSSCVVDFEEAQIDRKKREIKKHGEWEDKILLAWQSLGGGNMDLGKILEEAQKLSPPTEGKRDRSREYLRRALSSLIKNGGIVYSDGKLADDIKI